MKRDLLIVFGSIVTSLLGITAIVQYLVLFRGVSSSGRSGFLGIGPLAMLPGILLGATALWVATRD